jgi:hypothetical protein
MCLIWHHLASIAAHVEQVANTLAQAFGTEVLAVVKPVDTKVLAVTKPTGATFIALDKLAGKTIVATTFIKCAVTAYKHNTISILHPLLLQQPPPLHVSACCNIQQFMCIDN